MTKGVNDAARPPEGGPAEVEGLSISSLPLIFDTHPARMTGYKLWVFFGLFVSCLLLFFYLMAYKHSWVI